MPTSWKRPKSACRGLCHLAGVQRILCARRGNILPLLCPVNRFSHLPVRSLKKFFLSSNTRSAQHHEQPKALRRGALSLRPSGSHQRSSRGAAEPSTWAPGDSASGGDTRQGLSRHGFHSAPAGEGCVALGRSLTFSEIQCLYKSGALDLIFSNFHSLQFCFTDIKIDSHLGTFPC